MRHIQDSWYCPDSRSYKCIPRCQNGRVNWPMRLITWRGSHRVWLPDDLEVAYRDADGDAQMLYFDRQHNNSFALIHPDAGDDSVPLKVDGVEPGTLEVRLLSALDIAVSKIGRFGERDRGDIAALAENGLIRVEGLRRRAEEAAQHYLGDEVSLKTSIDRACRLVADAEVRREKKNQRDKEPPSPDPCA